MATYQSEVLPPKVMDKVEAMLAAAPAHEVTALRTGLAEDPKGCWWFGTYAQGGEMAAVAFIYQQTVHLYSIDDAALVSMGMSMAKAFGNKTGSGTHQIFGIDKSVDAFWDGFKGAKRTHVGTVELQLMTLLLDDARTEKLKESVNKHTSISLAQSKYAGQVALDVAQNSIEMHGFDPSKIAKAQHEAYCNEGIEAGRYYLANYRQRHAALIECHRNAENIVSVDTLFFPISARRPRVYASVLSGFSLMMQQEGAVQIQALIPKQNEALHEAALGIGYNAVAHFKLMKLR